MKTTKYISSVSMVLLITMAMFALPVMAAPSVGQLTRSFSAATVAPSATVTVTITPTANLPNNPAWGVDETLPAGFTYVSTTAFGHTLVGAVHRFTQTGGNAFTYTVTAPAAAAAYTFSGTFVDADRNTGTVGGATQVTVQVGGGGQQPPAVAGTIPRIWDQNKNPPIPYTWSVYNFEGFFYDLKDDLGKEQLIVLQPDLSAGQRTIDKDRLLYSTQADPKQLKVVKEAFAGSAAAATAKGLERTAAGQAFDKGNYDIVGWQADRYVAVNGKIDKLAKLLFEHGTASAEKKSLTIGETWDIGGGWTLTAQSIDAKATPRQAWLVLSKDGVKKDDKVISEKNIYTYVEKSLAGETDVPLFVTYIDSVFAGQTTDMVQLRYTWVIDPAVTTIKGGDKFGIFEVVTLDTTGKRLVLNNTDSTVSLSQDGTVDIMGAIKFKVADKANVLRFMPTVVRTIPGKYETRGTIWNETAKPGALSGAPATWNVYNFAAFFYDLKDDLGKEQLIVLQPDLAAGQRTIDKDRLLYSTQADPKQLKVVKEAFAGDAAAAAAKGLERTTAGQAFAGGNYDIVGWQADRYVAVNGKIDKLAKLLFEHGTASAEKKSLTIGETWDIGGGWTLTANSIDAKATPRQAWLVLSKDGVKKDDKVISEKNIYTYVEKSLAGETDVPLFVTYIDSVFAGQTTDMVQLRYTWVIDPAVTTIKGGDKFGIFEVVTLDTTGKRLVLNNTDSTVSLSQDGTVDLMGAIKFKVADQAGVLRFYPKVDYEIGVVGPSVTPVGTPSVTVPQVNATVKPTNVTATPVMTEATPAKAATAAATKTPKEPGFEAVFAIAGLLAVAYLVLRQKK